jgi:protein SCO1/2
MKTTPVHAGKEPAASPADAASGTRRFFLGTGLPVFLFAAVALYEAALLAIIFAPLEYGWLGDFAREFKIWCFRYDPRTGGMEWAAVGMMLLEPIFVVVVTVFLWRRALATQPWRSSWRAGLAGLGVASVAIGAVLALGGRSAVDSVLPPFPGERIRTRILPPEFSLVDQTGRACSLAELRGRVVLVTGIYAMCSTSCPEILIETRRLLDSLPAAARAQVRVLALSLSPEYDTADLMAAVAAGYGFKHPEFRYLNGAPAVVHPILDQLQFARSKNPATGVIEHANLLMLIDPEGLIAYRFNLNPRHQAWLREAILALSVEARGVDSQ